MDHSIRTSVADISLPVIFTPATLRARRNRRAIFGHFGQNRFHLLLKIAQLPPSALQSCQRFRQSNVSSNFAVFFARGKRLAESQRPVFMTRTNAKASLHLQVTLSTFVIHPVRQIAEGPS
jgi:hypothetical protein